MPAGIRIRNQEQSLVIDETFFNFVFISKHTITFSTGNSSGLWTGGSSPSAVLSIPGLDAPIAAARGTKGWVLAASGRVGGNWVFHFSGGLATSTATVGDTIEVFVFDRPRVISGPGFGLRVFDASSKQTFDSNQRYMRTVDVRSFSTGLPAMQSVSGNIAQVALKSAWAKSTSPVTPTTGFWLHRAGFTRSVTGGYYCELLNYAEGSYSPSVSPPFDVSESMNTTIMCVDVSGY